MKIIVYSVFIIGQAAIWGWLADIGIITPPMALLGTFGILGLCTLLITCWLWHKDVRGIVHTRYYGGYPLDSIYIYKNKRGKHK